MPARIIDGKAIAQERRARLAEHVRQLAARGLRPCLAAVSVHADAGWSVYLKNQAAACAAVGIAHRSVELPAGSSQEDLSEAIEALNADGAVHGIILQNRLGAPGTSSAGLSEFNAQAQLSPDKDVEGVSPANLGMVLAGRPVAAPCTAVAAVELAKWAFANVHGRDLRGVEAVVVGASTTVGKPTAQLLLAAGATVTTCHIDTRDLGAHTRGAELLVAAVGRAGLIGAELVKPGAVVIDVGINRVALPDGRSEITGDVAAAAAGIASALTPVPGGVGALTTTILLEATVAAAERLAEARPAIDGSALARVLGAPGLDLAPEVADRIANLLARHLVAVPGTRALRSALERRLARGVLVLDGAMGSELIVRGVPAGAIARANLDHPDLVQDIHRAYVAAGAEALTANTFGINRLRLHGDRELVARLAQAGVRLARLAAQGAPRRGSEALFVLGSIGPLGPVVGAELARGEAEDAFAEIALALADAGVDGFAIETMPSTAEAAAALAGVRRVSRLPALVSRSIARDDAAELGEFARAMEAGGASAVGVNCAAGPRTLLPVVARLAALSRLPVLARPNAGFPTRGDGGPRYHLRSDYLVAQARAYVAAGAGIIGGCCGIGPDHIAALATALAGAPLPARATAVDTVAAAAPAAPPASELLSAALAGRFPIVALLPGRLPPLAAGAALQRLAAAGAAGVGLLSGWPGSARGTRLPAQLRHLQDVCGVPAVLELLAADTSLREAQEALLTAHLLGIRTVIIDDGVFSAETRADAVAAGSDAGELLRLVGQLNAGRDLAGTRLDEPTRFTAGVRLASARLAADAGAVAAAHAEAGARFLSLQPVYDPALFRTLMAGLRSDLPLFAEVLVLPDAATADELDNELPALSVPQRLKARLAADVDDDARGVLRFLGHWRSRLAGAFVMLPDDRTVQAERILRELNSTDPGS